MKARLKIVGTPEEWNQIVKTHVDERFICGADGADHFRDVISFERITVTLHTIEKFEAIDYKFWLNGEPDWGTEELAAKLGGFTRRLKGENIPVYSRAECNKIMGAGNFDWYSDKFNGTRNVAWEYDMNSAFVWSALEDWPDTTKTDICRVVGPNEIGLNGTEVRYEGEWAELVFPRMKCPNKIRELFEEWYRIKATTTSKIEKKKVKRWLVSCIGDLQNKNPYIRNVIVGRCNRFMRDLIDEDTLAVKTDAIISRKPRPDLKVGTGLGEFKVEREGELYAYKKDVDEWDDVEIKGLVYQWNLEKMHHTGITVATWREGQDLLKHELAHDKELPYEFDNDTGFIRRRTEE